MARDSLIRFRRGNQTEWLAINNPNGAVLAAGEPGFDSVNNLLKVGDGTTPWSSLSPVNSGIDTFLDGFGTSGNLPLFSDANTLTNSIIHQSGSKVGIGTSTPSHKLSITDGTLLGGVLVSGGGTPGLSIVDTTDSSSHGVYGSDNGILLVSADITSVGGSSSSIKFGVQNATQAIITTSGVGIGTDTPTQKLDVNSSGIRIRDDHTPASASASGNKGDIVWDSNYVYICISTNTWKRAALSTW
jgi:hypothetical protein